MSKEHKTFIDLSLEGNALLNEIDDFVAAWHKNPRGEPLHTYLGMKKSEYSLWLRDPYALAYIVKARHDDVPLTKVVNDNYEQLRMAARAEDQNKVKRLRQWLQREGKLD